MYALVNGQEWRTCGPVTAPKAFAQLFVAEYFDMVGAGLCSNTEIYFKIINLQGEGTYFLGDTSSNYALYWGHNKYYTDATHTGEITIEQIDSMTNQVEKLPYRVSGTFSFTAINEANSDTVSVTKGYFNKIDVYVF
ncbi:MAG: DUF6252 family protein [Bacteroidia bacterium]|nr:DUF6252 family protein [Bacteroidia bacterium]